MPWWCGDCRKYFSVRTKTVMHRSKLPMRTWLFAIYIVATNLKGVSSLKLHRDLGIRQATAWHLLHRIRKAFESGDDLLSGPVEIDESFLGGTARNRPAHRRLTPVVGIRDRKTREIRVGVLTRASHASLLQFLAMNASGSAHVYSDGNRAYQGLPQHTAVRHSVSEYVAGQAHTNGIESFWAMLKRAFHGTFHHFSPKHMARYVTEMATRQSWRELDTVQILERIAQRLVGKQLSYQRLIGRRLGLPVGAIMEPMKDFYNRTLFHRDNLDVLRNLNSNSIDLIATDPPFNKGRDFHATPDSLAAGARFQDRWSWERDVHQDWVDQLTDDHPQLMEAIESARYAHSDGMGAYMCFMAVRLLAMHRVLRCTGGIYLHCDPTASHYLKAVMDAIFGWKNFENEIIWCYKLGGRPRNGWPRKHDIILFYRKGKTIVFNSDAIRVPYDSTGGYISSGRKIVKGKEYKVNPLGKVPEDWWQIPALNRQSKERTSWPTQKPSKLYE